MGKKRTGSEISPREETNPKQTRTEYNVTPEEFIKAWQTSDTPQEVADLLNMPKPIVLARASTYRAAGIKLKKMKRGNKRELNVDALNALIQDIDAKRNSPT
jgi:hypothetical protein